MQETQTPSPEFEAQTQEALEVANGTQAPAVVEDDVEFFNNASEASRRHIDVTDIDSTVEQPVAVTHKTRSAVLAGVGIVAAVAGGAAAAGPIGDVIDSHISQVEEQNTEWVEEQQEAERKMVQDGVITIDVPEETSK